MLDIGVINVKGLDYNVADVNARISIQELKNTKYKIVSEKPSKPDTAIIYLVKGSGNSYEQWVYIEGAWTQLNGVTIDTSDLMKKSDVTLTDNVLNLS